MSGDGVRVEPSQLEGKAAEIGTEISDSSGFPSAPCDFAFVQLASAQVQAGSLTLKSFVASGNREASNLATVLNTAAGVYRSVDERTREALEHDPPLAVPIDPVPVNPPLQPPVPAIEAPRPAGMPGGDTGGYLDPKAAAQIIHSGDPAPMRSYAEEARSFAQSLRSSSDQFSLSGLTWGGPSADSAGTALQRHKDWLNKIAEQYEYLATQADDMADAQDKWAAQHPTVEEIEQVEQEMQQAIQTKDRVALHIAQDKYAKLFEKSEVVLTGYSADVSGKGLLGVPKPPPGATPIEPVTGNGDPRKSGQPNKNGGSQQPGSGDGTGAPQHPTGTPSPAAQPMSAQQPSGQPAGSGAPSGDGTPSGGGAPSGGMPGGLPGGGSSAGTPRLPTDPSLRPAALGGGGAGGGGAGGGGGGPTMPLSPAVSAETVAPSAPTHAASATPGAAASGGAAGGGMGGGMAPMHGAGHGNQGKEKRRDPSLSPDEDLYTEDRPWTEPVIGNRRRRDVQEGKESQ
jgi:ESX-1 secreted protein B PE domain/PPE family